MLQHDERAPYGRVYVIECIPTGKPYVGQTKTTLAHRFNGHVRSAKVPARTQPISNAIRKYGRDAFTIRELEVCYSREELDAAECRWAHELNSFAPHGYNLRAGNGPGSVSEETRNRLRASMTPDRRAALSALYKGRSVSRLGPAASAASLRKPMTLLSPAGVEVLIEDSKRFATENRLDYALLRGVYHGRRLSHRGWRLIPEAPVCETPIPLRDSFYRCPSCLKEWSTRRGSAQQHVTGCVLITRCLTAAYERGNIKEPSFLRALEARKTQRVDDRVKRITHPTRSQVVRFSVLSPGGDLFADVAGMKAFALTHGLPVPDFSALLRGKKRHLRGWTLVDATFDPPLEVSEANRLRKVS